MVAWNRRFSNQVFSDRKWNAAGISVRIGKKFSGTVGAKRNCFLFVKLINSVCLF